MHDAYAGKWYRTLTFVQKTTRYRPDGTTNISTWFESLEHAGAGRDAASDRHRRSVGGQRNPLHGGLHVTTQRGEAHVRAKRRKRVSSDDRRGVHAAGVADAR